LKYSNPKPSHCEAFSEAKAVAICLIYLGARFREIASLFSFLNRRYTTGRLAMTCIGGLGCCIHSHPANPASKQGNQHRVFSPVQGEKQRGVADSGKQLRIGKILLRQPADQDDAFMKSGNRFREIASLFNILNLRYTSGRLAMTGL